MSDSGSASASQTTNGFLDTLGVNIHSGTTPGNYGNSAMVLASLRYLGITHVRTALPAENVMASTVKALGEGGLKFDFVANSDITNGGLPGLDAFVKRLAAFDAAHPDSIFAIEGLNEINIYPFNWLGDGSIAGAVSFQKALYAAVKGHADLVDIPVINLSVGYESQADYAKVGDLGRWSDFANSHPYTNTYQTPDGVMESSIGKALAASGGDPVILTETGYTTTDGHLYLGTSEQAQAKMILNNLFNAYENGSQKTYLYELFNSTLSPDAGERNFGLFHGDGTPKPVAEAIHNLTRILSWGSSGDAAAPEEGTWSLNGKGDALHSMALAKSDGVYDIVLWNDLRVWDMDAKKEFDLDLAPTRIDFGSVQAVVYVYDPMQGTDPIAVFHDVSSITVPVGANPLIVEVGATGPIQIPELISDPVISLTGADLIANIDLLASAKGLERIELVGGTQVRVSTTDTLDYILKHYGHVIDKVGGELTFVVETVTSRWRLSEVFDRAGDELYRVDYPVIDGISPSKAVTYADGSQVIVRLSPTDGDYVAPEIYPERDTTLPPIWDAGVLRSHRPGETHQPDAASPSEPDNAAIPAGEPNVTEPVAGGVGSVTIVRDAFGIGADMIYGAGEGSDTLVGGAGDDRYFVNTIDDVIIETADGGYDVVYTAISYTLNGGTFVESLSTQTHMDTAPLNLIGNFHDQQIIGNYGDNVLNGNGGVDTLIGLFGDDTYVVGDARARIEEHAGQGYDVAYTRTSYALEAGVSIEVLSTQTVTDTAPIDLSGNEFAQVIVGNAGANVIDGGGGADTLMGLAGDDVFAFSTALGNGNVDTLTDFVSGSDTIQLSASVFGGLVAGSLAADAFHLGASATTSDQRIIYDKASGSLFYDADGSGEAEAILFARLAPGTELAPVDLIVVP